MPPSSSSRARQHRSTLSMAVLQGIAFLSTTISCGIFPTERSAAVSHGVDVRQPAEFAAKRQFVDTALGRIAVVENGTGPVAVFLHGLPLNGFQWRHQLVGLADVRRCIAIDLMGLGHSEVGADQDLTFSVQAQMVVATLDAMGIESFDLVGSDSGGGVAQIVATSVPDRIRSLVIMNADVHDNWPPPAIRVVHEAAKKGVLDDLLASYLTDPAKARSPQSLTAAAFERPDLISDQTLEVYLGPITATSARRANLNRFVALQNNAETVAIEGALQRLDAPTLILWGTDDGFFGLEWAYWLRDTIPGAKRVVEFEGAKLFFAEERPEAVNREIRAHWTSVPISD